MIRSGRFSCMATSSGTDAGVIRLVHELLEALDIAPDGTIYLVYNHDLGYSPRAGVVDLQRGGRCPRSGCRGNSGWSDRYSVLIMLVIMLLA